MQCSALLHVAAGNTLISNLCLCTYEQEQLGCLGGSAGNHQGLTYGTVLVRRPSKKLGGTDGKEAQALKDGALLANPVFF